jgi:hypothetical protein
VLSGLAQAIISKAHFKGLSKAQAVSQMASDNRAIKVPLTPIIQIKPRFPCAKGTLLKCKNAIQNRDRIIGRNKRRAMIAHYSKRYGLIIDWDAYGVPVRCFNIARCNAFIRQHLN